VTETIPHFSVKVITPVTSEFGEEMKAVAVVTHSTFEKYFEIT
jgi:hypothetical protein